MKSNNSYRYRVVDVFTSEPLEGNPLAVFPDAAGLNSDLMQKIARELNLSETVFVCPPTRSECASKIRIFTPGKEMDFAGHPTVGTAFILLDEGMVPKGTNRFFIEENIGTVAVAIDAGSPPKIWLTTPCLREGVVVEKDVAAQLLGLKAVHLLDAAPQVFNAGNPTLFIPVVDRQLVDAISFDTSAWRQFKEDHPDPLCVFAFAPVPSGAYSRMFAPDYGIREDPASGSSTGPLASYMMKHNLLASKAGTRFYSEQGNKMGRRSILHVHVQGERGADGIAVGGNVISVIEGRLAL